MTTFKTTDGAEWEINLNFAQMVRIKDRLGLCLIDLTEEDRAAKRSEADLKKVSGDVVLFMNLLFVLCEKQSQGKSITDTEFGELFDGDSVMEAMQALDTELTVFTLPRDRKEAAREMVKKSHKAKLKAMFGTIEEIISKQSDLSNSHGN